MVFRVANCLGTEQIPPSNAGRNDPPISDKFLRGERVFSVHNIKRYRYLISRTTEVAWKSRQKAKVKHSQHTAALCRQSGSATMSLENPKDPRPEPDVPHDSCLFNVYDDATSGLQWAPRDALAHASATLSEWRSHGYGTYELLLSIIGANSDQKGIIRQNKFVWVGYSYFHLSFDRFVRMLRDLDPIDRTFCFMIPSGAPVHMYFDIDGDFSQFPSLTGQDEACLNEFMFEVSTLFVTLFSREMNITGLTLLQATSATKLSWHLHLPSEAFRDVRHMKRFVLLLNQQLATKKETLLYMNGKSLVDPAPYMERQNFRAPYCRKPNKTALLPRTFSLDDASGRLLLNTPESAEYLHANIDEELLWRCHPALAQPGPGYEYLQLEELEEKKNKGVKRRASDDTPLTTSNRARRLSELTDAASSSRKQCTLPRNAIPESCRIATEEEMELIKNTLRAHVGAMTEIDSCTIFKNKFGGHVEGKGICTAGSAICPTLRQAATLTSFIHKSNRLAFTMNGLHSSVTFKCFKCDHGRKGHDFTWDMSDADRHMMGVVSDAPLASTSIPTVSESQRQEEQDEQQAEEVEDVFLTSAERFAVQVVSHVEEEAEEKVERDGIRNEEMKEETSGDHSSAGVAPAVTQNRKERSVARIHEAAAEPALEPVFLETEKVASAEQLRKDEAASAALFLQIFLKNNADNWNGTMRSTPDEMFKLCCEFKDKAQMLESFRPKNWQRVETVNERYLSLENQRVYNVFNQATHLALESGQGTNKTGVIVDSIKAQKLRKPDSRILMMSGRRSWAGTMVERFKRFDRDMADSFEEKIDVRSYTDPSFRLPSIPQRTQQTGEEEAKRMEVFKAKTNEVNRALVQTQCLIISPQSLHRLFGVTDEDGNIITPEYDIIIADEFMDLLGLFHGSTMADKRRTTLDKWTFLMKKAGRVWLADAGFHDEMAISMLGWLCGGKAFVKLQNTAQTIKRTYHHHRSFAQFRAQIILDVKDGKFVFIVCNTKSQVESILNDPELMALGLRIKALHSDSVKEDRDKYINSVESWKELDVLIISPVISHGVNFDEIHFDVAYLYGSDHSTTAVQTFQQVNRVRHLSDNQVHVFIDAHPNLYKNLLWKHEDIKRETYTKVAKYQRDFFSQRTTSYGNVEDASHRTFMQVKNDDAPPTLVHRRADHQPLHNYVFDTRVNFKTGIHEMFDSPGNELYIWNETLINFSRVHYERELLNEIRKAGGTILDVQLKKDQVEAMQECTKAIREADSTRKEQLLHDIQMAPDISAVVFEEMKSRQRHHALVEGELNTITKAEWKLTYGIPLEDTARMHEIENFAERFGSEKRQRQFRLFKAVKDLKARPIVISDTSDPIPFLTKDEDTREHLEHVLHSIGFSNIWDKSTVIAAQHTDEKLQPGSAFRLKVLRNWETTDISYRRWWTEWKHKHSWKVDMVTGDLLATSSTVNAEQAVSGKELFRALLIGCRQFLDSQLGCALKKKQLSSKRRLWACSLTYQIDRSRWDNFVS